MIDKTDKSKEQEAAEADVESFHDDLGPFVVAAETTRMPMVFTDAKAPDNPIIFANDSYLSLTGYDREEVLGKSFDFSLADAADAESVAEIAAGDKSETDSEFRYRRKDGSVFWAAVFISPVRDEAGAIVQHFASFVDLTAHKDDAAQSRMLIDELNHRVKNTLSTVQSIVWQALRFASDPDAIREAIGSRLAALSRSHDLLTRENWDSAGLRDVITDALEPFRVSDGWAERIVIAGKDIRIPPGSALALGLAFNELATNAVKYGAFSNATGSVLIEWTFEATPEGPRLMLHWREKGGPPVEPPSRKGFGSRMIEHGLAHELQGSVELDYPSDGAVCTMNIPMPKGAVHE